MTLKREISDKEYRLNIRIPPELLESLRERAALKGLTLTSFVIEQLMDVVRLPSTNQIAVDVDGMKKRIELLENIVLDNYKIGNDKVA